MKYDLADCVQREHHYSIVDEVDSILIDEARTPLIISGPAEESTDKYYKIDRIIPKLRRDLDFQVDEKARTVNLTEEGVEKSEGVACDWQPLRASETWTGCITSTRLSRRTCCSSEMSTIWSRTVRSSSSMSSRVA